MENYFINCETQEEARQLYHRLAMANHPDRGGNTATMQEINNQYSAWVASFAHSAARQRQAEAHQANRASQVDFIDLDEITELLKAKIQEIINLPEIEIEICGLWIWITGNTRPVKDALKAAGCRWSHEKTAWYYPTVPSHNRQHITLDEVRARYGSTKISREDEKQPAPALA